MRSVILILLVALMPLRMWAAESMAISMAQGEMAAAVMGTAAMPADCPMMAKASGAETPADEQAASEHANCVTCQLCAALAMSPSASTASHAHPAAPRDRAVHRFASADPYRKLKPPIS